MLSLPSTFARPEVSFRAGQPLQVAPDSLLLVGGALTELMLSFRPLVPGRLDALVHVVDTVCGPLSCSVDHVAIAHVPLVFLVEPLVTWFSFGRTCA